MLPSFSTMSVKPLPLPVPPTTWATEQYFQLPTAKYVQKIKQQSKVKHFDPKAKVVVDFKKLKRDQKKNVGRKTNRK